MALAFGLALTIHDSAITSGLLIAVRAFGGTIGLAVCKGIILL